MALIGTLVSFSAGTIIRSADVNQNFTDIRDAFNNTAVLTDVARTITAVHTFDLDPAAPFAVSLNSAVVANLDADKLDGFHESSFAKLADAETVSGAWTFSAVVTVSAGGIAVTGNSTITGTLSGITTLTATTLAGTLSTAAQPNVTSLGTLTGLTVNGTATATTLAGTLSTAAQPNVTSLGTLTGLTVNGTATATTLAGTLSTAAQPNVTSLGTLTGLTVNGLLFVNDSANANMTIGVTINQGANDDEILALKSSDVAHGMTSLAETDTYAVMKKASALGGGLNIIGYEATGTIGVAVSPVAGTGTTTKSTAALAPFVANSFKKSGTGSAAVGADENIAVFRNAGTTRFILDGDGDSHQDVGTAWTNFDDHDDVALLTELSVNVARDGDPLRHQLNEWMLERRPALERLKLVTFNEDGHHFMNWSRLTMLLVGAIRQLHGRVATTERRLLTAQN